MVLKGENVKWARGNIKCPNRVFVNVEEGKVCKSLCIYGGFSEGYIDNKDKLDEAMEEIQLGVCPYSGN